MVSCYNFAIIKNYNILLYLMSHLVLETKQQQKYNMLLIFLLLLNLNLNLKKMYTHIVYTV